MLVSVQGTLCKGVKKSTLGSLLVAFSGTLMGNHDYFYKNDTIISEHGLTTDPYTILCHGKIMCSGYHLTFSMALNIWENNILIHGFVYDLLNQNIKFTLTTSLKLIVELVPIIVPR